jgi:MAF protein
MGVTMHNRDVDNSRVPVVLASASPRRRDLLGLLGILFSIQIADVDEAPLPGEGPEALATRLAQAKALTISQRSSPATASSTSSTMSPSHGEKLSPDLTEPSTPCPTTAADPVVLAADTVVVLDDSILGKPADDAEAIAMLNALRGRVHRVLTGVAVAMDGEVVRTCVTETRVWMRAYGADEVERYIRSGIPFDRAGAYGIQDVEFRPVERIEGCYTNVVGLPLCEVRRGITALDPSREAAGLPEGELCHLCERARGAASRP